MKRVGIIGTGLIAKAHLNGYLVSGHEVCITALCDSNEQKMQEFSTKNRLENVVFYRDYRELLDSGSVDVVSICTSNDMHAPISLYALEKGIHILCEKPLGLDWLEALRMAEIAQHASVRAVTGFTYRNIPAIRLLREWMDQEVLGDIRQFRGTFFADRMAPINMPLEWRHLTRLSGTGVIGDLVSHLLDMAIFLMEGQNDPICRVSASTGILVKERRCPETDQMVTVETDEVCHVGAQTKRGVDLLFDASRYAPFDMTIQVSGTKGSARFHLDKPLEVELALRESIADHFAKYRSVMVPSRLVPADERHIDRMNMQIKLFLDATDDPLVQLPDFRYGAAVQRLLDIMAQAARTERPIDVKDEV